jgi:DNA polymerase III delta prime subunit
MQDNFLWVEQFRPRTVDQCILPESLKQTFNQFVIKGNVPNLILAGPAGTGKTSIARAILEQLQCDYIIINGSLNGNIDTLRTTIQQFASTVSFSGGRKYVILDEADYLSNLTQASLRNFMEEYSANCGFILTCNYKNKIIDPLHSRCSVVEFKFSKQEIQTLSVQFMRLCSQILKTNNVTFDPKAIAALVIKHKPDWRRVINELQRYASTGHIDMGVVTSSDETSLTAMFEMMKDKNFTGVRQWVGEQTFDDSANIFRALYDKANLLFTKSSIPSIVLIIAKYQYYSGHVADQEINLAACLAEIMIEAEFE